LPNGAIRSPDAAWVRLEHWQALTFEQQKKYMPLCPDFVVELRSASDELIDLQAILWWNYGLPATS
jgi:Uma2 family endonuclease